MPKDRGDLMVLTRDRGVRKENPLMTVGRGYYPKTLGVRTPAVRKEADAVLAANSPSKTPTSKGITVKMKDGTIKQYARGGMVKRTGFARVHRGERVLTKSQVKSMRGKHG